MVKLAVAAWAGVGVESVAGLRAWVQAAPAARRINTAIAFGRNTAVEL